MLAALKLYAPLLGILLAGLTGQLRACMPQDGFWHTKWGHLLLTVLGCVLGGLGDYLRAGQLTQAALVAALVAAATAAFSASKPMGKSVSPDMNGQKGHVEIRTLAALGFISLLLSVILLGCAHAPPGPPTPSQAYLNGFSQCMEAQGMSALAAVGVQVWNILEQPNATQTQIIQEFEQLGIASASAAVQAAALCAVSSWAGMHPLPNGWPPTQAQAAVRVIQGRYARHPGVHGIRFHLAPENFVYASREWTKGK